MWTWFLDLDVVMDLFEAGISERTILRGTNWSKSKFLAVSYLDKFGFQPGPTCSFCLFLRLWGL